MSYAKSLILVAVLIAISIAAAGCLDKSESDAINVAVAQLDKDIATLPPETALPLLNAKAQLLNIQTSSDSVWSYIGTAGGVIGIPGLVLVLRKLAAYRASLITVVNAVQQAKVGSNASTYTLSKEVLRTQLDDDALVQKVIADVKAALAKEASASAIKNS